MTRPLSLRDARRQAGFSFIEILIVMSIIAVLVTMVAVIIPVVQERGRRTKAMDNIRQILTLMSVDSGGDINKQWPSVNGKNFVLWTVAKGKIDIRNKQDLQILFSPGDTLYTFDAVGAEGYKDVKVETLRAGGREDFKRLTSWAGRRNAEREHKITPNTPGDSICMCDDDDGALHAKGGLIVGSISGTPRFADWSDLGVSAPENPDQPEGMLGDNAPSEELKHLSSGT